MNDITYTFLTEGWRGLVAKYGEFDATNVGRKINPYLAEYIGKELPPKSLKKRARRKFLVDSTIETKKEMIINLVVTSSQSLASIAKKIGISSRLMGEVIKADDAIHLLVRERDYNSKSTRIAKYASRGKGSDNHSYVKVTDDVRSEIYKKYTKLLNGDIDIPRKELYTMFNLSPNVVRRILKENGLDINKLPHRGRRMFGSRNYWYMKPPPKGAGAGISGWVTTAVRRIFFRSLLECQFFIFWSESGILYDIKPPFVKWNNGTRTYMPDAIIGDTIVEIKPHKIIQAKLEVNELKWQAARNWCQENGYIFKVESERNLPEGYVAMLDMYFDKGAIEFIHQKALERYTKLRRARCKQQS